MAKDGMGIILASIGVTLVCFLLWRYFRHPVFLVLLLLTGLFSMFNLYFFRDPERKIPENKMAVLSPADGKVVQIIDVEEDQVFHHRVRQISIFLSVFNVHVNRVPISGKVNYLKYIPGKFLVAFADKASTDNEQTAIGIVDVHGHQVMFKQIAGLIARRIVCRLKEGDLVTAGERMGLIRYGSRVDVLVPMEARIYVKLGQHVTGGETILATFPDNGDLKLEEKSAAAEPILMLE